MTRAIAGNQTIERLPVNDEFALVSDPGAVDRAAAGLKAHGFDARIVPDGDAARELVLGLVPDGAEVARERPPLSTR